MLRLRKMKKPTIDFEILSLVLCVFLVFNNIITMSLQAQQDLQKTQAVVYDMANRRRYAEQQMQQVFTQVHQALDTKITASSPPAISSSATPCSKCEVVEERVLNVQNHLQIMNTVFSSEIHRIHDKLDMQTQSILAAIKKEI